MKILRQILLTFLLIILLLAVIGLFLPRHIRLERMVIMDTDREAIFNQVNNVHNWEHWSPWHQLDSTIKPEYFGPGSGVGAGYTYHSTHRKIGSGKITVIASAPYDSIVMDLNSEEYGKTTGRFLFQESGTGTQVTWIIESDLGMNPFSRWFGLFMNKIVGRILERGLTNLNIAASHSRQYSAAIIQKEIPARIILSIRDTASPETISQKFEMIYSKVFQLLQQRKLSQSGPPFAIYHSFSSQSFDMEAGVPIKEIIVPPAGITCREIPAGNVVMTSFFGPYEATAIAYQAIEKYIKEQKLEIAGSPWEEYITDPSSEPDTAKWQTDIYYPVK